MTDTRFSPVDAPEREAVREPSKVWRNWWRVPAYWEWRCLVCGAEGIHRLGEITADHCKTYPSKDIAESATEEVEREHWLGAFPDGERP